MGTGNILTVVDAYAPDAAEAQAVYRLLLRLANRHGCHGDHCPHQDRTPGCTVHDDDRAYLHQWLRMLGFEDYGAQPHTDYVPHGAVNVSYRRPG